MPDQYSNQLSAYLDDELEGSARARVTAHLAGCAECSALLADLRAIVSAAPGYAGRTPSRDLWKGIEARLDEPDVISIDSARPSARPPARRFGWRELIAASLVMAAVGGGAVYLALRPAVAPGVAPMAAAPDTVLRAGPDSAPPAGASNVEFAERKYDSAVRDLELMLDAGRSRLDTATVRSVEESLRKIDVAIAEARAAIQRDPSNAYLNRQIAANMRRKLDLLRIATNAIAART
jgi:hypothetical protein